MGMRLVRAAAVQDSLVERGEGGEDLSIQPADPADKVLAEGASTQPEHSVSDTGAGSIPSNELVTEAQVLPSSPSHSPRAAEIVPEETFQQKLTSSTDGSTYSTTEPRISEAIAVEPTSDVGCEASV